MSDPPEQQRTFRRRGLGRGLDALLSSRGTNGGEPILVNLDPRSVAPNPEQPRHDFDEESLDALGESIRLHGLLHPIVVQRDGAGYGLVAGERRLRAAQRAGVASIPAIVRPAAESARHSLEMALTENLLRTDLNPMEEAAAYARLTDAFGLSHEAIALRLGRSRPSITNAIRLLALPASVQEAVADGRLSAGHARAILALPGEQRQEALAREVMLSGLSVRETERSVQSQAPSGHGARTAAAPPRKPEALAPDDEAIRRGLESALGLPVHLQRNPRTGGRVVIDFLDDADLDGLYRRLGGTSL
ncbi:MAG: ParB/RepB/Spo0J family partition protein [Candidatus Dormibacteraeota bacterium]|nr:ParB/RepB/Spo0J family partition protein [Candidatus Dormibacteraeota bacterium]